MKTFAVTAVMLALASASFAEDAKKGEGEIQIFVSKDGKPADLSGWTATLVLEPKGMAKRNLKLDLNEPKKKADKVEDHGGQTVDMEGGYDVELVVAEGGDDDHDKKDEEAGLAHFETKTSLVVYACSMNDSPPSDKPGKCSKCGMALKESDMEFTAVVIFKTKDGTKNAKGFAWPPEIPKTYADCISKIDEHLKTIKNLTDSGELEKVHLTAEKISQICKKLPDMAAKGDRAAVEKTANEVVGLFKEIDEAADGGKKDETLKVHKAYVEKVDALRKFTKNAPGK